MTNLELLEQIQSELEPKECVTFSGYLLGSLSVLVEREVWEKALSHASHLMEQRKDQHAQVD